MPDEKSVEHLLAILDKKVVFLKSQLPRQAPLLIPKPKDPSKSTHLIDPLRALHLREACFHRIVELAESACDAFKNGNTVAGYLLVRAFMEAFALFWFFMDTAKDALKDGDCEKLREVLRRMLVGSRISQVKENLGQTLGGNSPEKGLDPISVPNLIKHVTKELPPFGEHYDFLCEVSHPNAMGLIKAYVKNDWDQRVAHFGKEFGSFNGHLASDLENFLLCLDAYSAMFNESLEVLMRFAQRCET
jgi:hypothetical protein